MVNIQDKRKQVELMQYQLNVAKMEQRLMELEDEKIMIAKSITDQEQKINEIK